MEAILPFKIKNEQKFYVSALKVGYNEMEMYKFIYVMQQSDMDIFPKMHDERINMLIYGWELCEDYKQKLNPNEWELPEELEMILKLLVPWSMDIWFSKEWDKCKYHLKNGLIHCLNRARDFLMRMPDMMQINWDFLLLYNLKPWNVLYLKNLTVTKEKTLENGAESIETEELPPTNEDISYVKLEQLPLIVLRLVKIFDQSSVDMVKTLCMRVIAAWNRIHQTELETSGSRRPYIPPEDKRCLLLICHIYLMAVYESDDVKGYVIDNMINNIRFYYRGFQNSTAMYAMDNLEYTPARFIALTNIHLRVQKRDFFDFFIWNKYDTSLVNLFGVVSQAYKSYLLGNLLMELNNMNEDDFSSNIPLYKRLMNSYVNEREKSELFLLNELDKLEAQRYAHNIIQTVRDVTDFKSKICKGNRMSNIGNYENSDDTVTPLADINSESQDDFKVDDKVEVKEDLVGEELEDEEERVRIKENELRLDPIFQNLPNNESILYYVYEVLAKKNYKGWHFAKIVLLVKIIDHELNMIETWRYHPGLTTDFMLNLEMKLSHHYVDLAKIFKDHAFLEQEFWLTAFYLNPTADLFETIKRLGIRNNRKRTDEHTKLVMSIDNIDAKYGLLSSTIDVKEIATLANTDDPDTDYDPLFLALHSLRVPDSLVKDMITAIFLPRNKSFAWVLDWAVLRTRCKMIMTSMKEKTRFVELNMAEANERLKYLIIDYEKYKNRPQLDYGTIEEGYENLMTSADFDKETDEEEEEEEDDFEDDEDVYESKKRGRGSFAAAARKKEEEKVQDENSQEDDPFLMGKRRTRARTAATLASFLFQTLPRSSRRKRNQKPIEEETNPDDDKTLADNDDKSSDSKSPITTIESPMPSSPVIADCDEKDSDIENISTKHIKECLKERPTFLNSTQGFQDLIDIWNVEKSALQSIDENCVSLMESSAMLQRAVKWKLLNKEINPMGCDEQEYIDETEMTIHNAEFAMKMELNLRAKKKEYISEKVWNEESVNAMEVDSQEEKNVTDEVDEVPTAQEAIDLESIVLEESAIEKVTEIEPNQTEPNKETPPAEDNSSEDINSDMSTAALKDSGEVSESNTEMHSKRNMVNSDIELEIEKLLQTEDLNKKPETTTEDLNEKTETTILCSVESTETEQENIIEEQLNKATINQETKKHEQENKETLEEENKTEIIEITEKESGTNEKPLTNTQLTTTYDLIKFDLEDEKESTEVKVSIEKDSDELISIDQETEENSKDAPLKLKDSLDTSAKDQEVYIEKPTNDKETKASHEILSDKDTTLQDVKDLVEKDSDKLTSINQEIEENSEDASLKLKESPETFAKDQEVFIEKPTNDKETKASHEILTDKDTTLQDVKVSIKKDSDKLTSIYQEIEENSEDAFLKLKESSETSAKDQEVYIEKPTNDKETKASHEILSDKEKSLQDVKDLVEKDSDKLTSIDQEIEENSEDSSLQLKENPDTSAKDQEVKIEKPTKDKEKKASHEILSDKEKSLQDVKDLVERDSDKLTSIDQKIEENSEDSSLQLKENPDTSAKDQEVNIEKPTKDKETKDFHESLSDKVKPLQDVKDSVEKDSDKLTSIDQEIKENSEDASLKLKESLETSAKDQEVNTEKPTNDKETKDSHENFSNKDKSLQDVKDSVEKDSDKLTSIDQEIEENSEDAFLKLKESLETSAIDQEVDIEKPINDKETKDSHEVLSDKDKSLQDVKVSIEKHSDKLTSTDHETEENFVDDSLKLKESLETSDKDQEVNIEKPTKDKETKDSQEILSDKGKSFQEETNSQNTNKTDTNTCRTLEHEDSTAKKALDKHTDKDQTNNENIEKDLQLKANTEDSITTKEEARVNSSETLPIGHELESTKTNETDTDSHSQSLHEESTLVLHYSSDEELDKPEIETEKLAKTESCDLNKDSDDPVILLDDATVASVKSVEYHESTDSDTQNLKNLCLTKNVKVLVQKLRASDLTSLRQPKVKLRRVTYEKYAEELKAKRRRIVGRAYLDVDDSSNSNLSYGTNTSSSDAYHPTRVKRKTPIRRHSMRHSMRTSESDNDSTNSDDLKLSTMVLKTKVRERRLSTPSSTQSPTFVAASSLKRALGPKSTRYAAGPKSARHSAGPKSSKQHLVVTPRSASGLKLRISNAEQTTKKKGVPSTRSATSIAYDEVIQLTSSSSDECIVNELTPIAEEVIEVDDHPLFEEEIIF